MGYHAYRLTCALGIASLLVALVGCGTTETPPEGATTPAPAPSEAAETGAVDQGPIEYPPPPSDVSGLRGWFEEAFPDAPWLARIKGIEYVKGEVPDSGGFSNAVVITTDLDFATELPVAEEISAALAESNLEWAKQFVIRFDDGNNIFAGDIIDLTP